MHAEPPAGARADTTARLQELVGALDALADQTAASMARELVQLVLELHGSALATIVETMGAERAGARLVETLLRDPEVEGVLLLHGLHPADLEQRVRSALARLHPHLGVQGVAVEAIDIADGRVRVGLGLSDAGRYRDDSADAVRREIEAALGAAAPDLAGLAIEGLPAHVATVAISSITVRRRAAATTVS